MRRDLALFLPLASVAILGPALPATAQTSAERNMYEPLYTAALRELREQTEEVEEVQELLAKETDLVRGCGLLNRSVTSLKATDKVLAEIENYTDKLRLRADLEAARKQRAGVVETIKLREGDIERMCKDLPSS